MESLQQVRQTACLQNPAGTECFQFSHEYQLAAARFEQLRRQYNVCRLRL